MTPSCTHVVIIPSYNTGTVLLQRTVLEAAVSWSPVWVVIDGSTDGSDAALDDQAGIRVLRRARNGGKGAAIRSALDEAAAQGFTHALTMDADGQHPADHIGRFMAASLAAPGALVLGVPQFGPDAPALRVKGRRISNWWANLETLWMGIDDSLFGFRVYPVGPLRIALAASTGMRGFDFEPEAAVRLVWMGVVPLNLPAPVLYPAAIDGGVSHFQYGRDNVLLTWMHVRLMVGMLLRLPVLIRRRAAAVPRAAPRP